MQFTSTLRQGYQQSNRKKNEQKKSKQAPKSLIINKPLSQACLYYIDSIYSGTVNASHYRQGFGIMQSINFHTFLGYFKNGRAQGLGLIILSSGTRIYGNFVKDQLTGIGLVDDKRVLKIGVWNKFQLSGIGYEYEYEKYLWRMVRFWRGAVSEIIKEEACDLNEKMPTLINLQHSLYFFLMNFLQGNYFPLNSSHTKSTSQQPQQISFQLPQSPSTHYIHPQAPRTIYFGLLQSGLQFGIGVKYDKSDKCVSQAGYYENGKLHGYGLKYNSTIKHLEIGMYDQGRKQGLFMHDDSGKVTYCLYHNNTFLETLELAGREFIRKKQKQHNYSKKSFISQKNTLDLDIYNNLAQKVCQSGQGMTKNKPENEAKNELEKILINKKQRQELKSKIPGQKDPLKVSDSDKTTAVLLKEKFKYFQAYEQLTFDQDQIQASQKMNSHRKQNIRQNSVQQNQEGRIQWKDQIPRTNSRQAIRRMPKRQQPVIDFEEQPIAEEQNPFDAEEKSTGKLNPNKMRSSLFRSNDRQLFNR